MPTGTRKGADLGREVAAILRGQLARAGRTQTQLATAASISQSQISKLLRGERPIDVDQLDRMCAALGLSIERVIEEADTQTEGRDIPWGALMLNIPEMSPDEAAARYDEIVAEGDWLDSQGDAVAQRDEKLRLITNNRPDSPKAGDTGTHH